MTTNFDALATRILEGGAATEADALAVLQAPDVELMFLVAAAGRLRREHFGNTVKVNYLVNLKSGLCPENCNYCSQAMGSEAPILKYSYLSKDETLKQAGAGLRGGATRVCMVSSGRGPSDRVLWAVIVERLEDQRALDLRDVEVLVDNGEVTLNGTVRRKEDKRRIEDIADLPEVRHVQNNLRVQPARNVGASSGFTNPGGETSALSSGMARTGTSTNKT